LSNFDHLTYDRAGAAAASGNALLLCYDPAGHGGSDLCIDFSSYLTHRSQLATGELAAYAIHKMSGWSTELSKRGSVTLSVRGMGGENPSGGDRVSSACGVTRADFDKPSRAAKILIGRQTCGTKK
jgi:hypothetical protein